MLSTEKILSFQTAKNCSNNPIIPQYRSAQNEYKREDEFIKFSCFKDKERLEFMRTRGREIANKYLTAAMAFASCAAIGIFSFKTGFGLKTINNLLYLLDTSDNVLAMAIRKMLPEGKLKIENISKKALAHMLTNVDNVDGLGRKGVSGAHKFSAFVKSFYKSVLKDNIQITNIKMKNKKVRDGNIIIEYLEDGIEKTFETNIGQGFTKGQQKLFKNLCNSDNNNGFSINNFSKTKFYKTYLDEGTEIKRANDSFADIYQTFFCQKSTGTIESITKDPFIDGVYSIKYKKHTGGASYPEKTVFVDNMLSEANMYKLDELCSDTVDKRIVEEIKSGRKLYNSKDIAGSVQCALKRGFIVNNNSGEAVIMANRAGTMFMAYCDETNSGSYKVRSFFPVLHGSRMHKELVLQYLKDKGNKLSIMDLPLVVGLKNDIDDKIYNELLYKISNGTGVSAAILTSFHSEIEYRQSKRDTA